MQFVDEATIEVAAGDGGYGLISFRREAKVPLGGPDGGQGGDGGDVVLEASDGVVTLLDHRYKRHYRAEVGKPGGTSNKTGRRGEDAVVPVPVGTIVTDVATGEVLADLREAAGPDTTIVGLTYPDVILGAYLDEGTRSLAELSVTAFEKLINPMLRRNYEAIGGIFVDVTDGTDGYVPLDRTTTLDPYGEIPVAVAEVCRLTWFCERKDIHPRSVGYERIAELIVAALPAR